MLEATYGTSVSRSCGYARTVRARLGRRRCPGCPALMVTSSVYPLPSISSLEMKERVDSMDRAYAYVSYDTGKHGQHRDKGGTKRHSNGSR